MLLEMKSICKDYPMGKSVVNVLKNVDLSVNEGAYLAIMGPSGSGKTTLMNILSALDLPTEGEVFFQGKDITKMSATERDKLRRQHVGFIFQSVALIPMMSAYENVDFSLRMARFTGNRKQRAEECLQLVGLGKRLHHLPQELSGGEQQRVAIARALSHKPEVIFADEPTAELDTNTALQVIKMFKELTDTEGITIVMTTHDTELMKLGDKLYQLEDGELIE